MVLSPLLGRQTLCIPEEVSRYRVRKCAHSRCNKFERATGLHIPNHAGHHWPNKREPSRENRQVLLFFGVLPVHSFVYLAISHHEVAMTNEVEEQVAAHIREIIHLALGVEGLTLRKLNELAGQTSRLKLSPVKIYAG